MKSGKFVGAAEAVIEFMGFGTHHYIFITLRPVKVQFTFDFSKILLFSKKLPFIGFH